METNKILAVIITLISGFYLLPTGVALWQNSGNTIKIFLLNFLLGWTLIGWIVALVWALR